MTTAVRAAVAALLKKPNLSERDRAHLKRWASDEYARDPIWQRLATAARERGLLPMDSFYEGLIEESLFMRRKAESVSSGIDFDLRHNERFHKWQLELTKKADDLADFYKWAEKYSGIAMFFYRFLRPVRELEDLHRREAELFRQRTRRPPKPTVRVARQDRKGRRKGFRKINAFIDLANDYLQHGFFDKSDNDAIALLTEIAFPDFDVDPEFVRTALRPTTTAGRRKVTNRALATKKS